MNSRVIKILLSLCMLLLLVLSIEWLLTESSEAPHVESPMSDEERQSQDVKLPELILAKQSLETYSDMVDRPLFIKGRKPILEVEEDTVNQEVTKIDDLILVGIYSIEGRMITLFTQHKADRKHLKKSQGDDISGWLLKEIQGDRVILEREGKQQTVMLRKPKTKKQPKPKPVARMPIKRKP